MNPPGSRWRPAYIGIGSNLNSPQDQVTRAIAELGALPDCVVTRASSLYRSDPHGPANQPDFINAVAAMLTTLSAHELLAKLQEIEVLHGRDRSGEHWGPRTLDLDLLVFSDQTIGDSDLTVPHPRIAERNFVLLPMRELAPHLRVPGLGTVTGLAESIATATARIERIASAPA